MVTLLCIVLGIVSFLMCMAILVQEPKQGGLSGTFGMGGDQMLGAGNPNAISKFTGILAGTFLVLCLLIGLVDQASQEQTGIKDIPGDSSGLDPSVGAPPDPGGAGAGAGTGSLTPTPVPNEQPGG